MTDASAHRPPTGIDQEYSYDAERGFAGGTPERQPPGLWVLFITEMWERFSYYGMRALFVLYLTATTAPMLADNLANHNPGFGWERGDAYTLYGVYTFMVYLTSIFGGIAADRLLGTHRSMLVGGWVIALGHLTLACAEFFKIPPGEAVTMQNAAGSLMSFLVGCALIVIGTGFFKPCVSVMVGQLYREGDARRDSGFTIFYMGINLGAFLSPLIAGYLGEKVGWHWGFGSAAVGMIIGLIFYQATRGRYLGRIGAPPAEPLDGRARLLVGGSLLALIAIPVVPLLLFATGGLGPIVGGWNRITGAMGTWGTAGLFTALLVGSAAWFLALQRPGERSKLAVIFILAFFGNIFFWSAFEQAGSSMTIFAAEQTDRTLWGLWGGEGGSTDVTATAGTTTGPSTAAAAGQGFPAAWYQSVNPLTILLFAPLFSWLWIWLDRRRANPSTPMKFAIGLWLLGLAFLAMVFGAMDAQEGKAGPHWLLITYVVVTWGELCLSPVGLSMVTKLAPARLQSLMMGLWFFSLALSNLVAGLVARFSERFVGPEADMTFIMPGLPGFFLLLVLFPIGMGVVILVLTPILRRMMGGVQ